MLSPASRTWWTSWTGTTQPRRSGCTTPRASRNSGPSPPQTWPRGAPARGSRQRLSPWFPLRFARPRPPSVSREKDRWPRPVRPGWRKPNGHPTPTPTSRSCHAHNANRRRVSRPRRRPSHCYPTKNWQCCSRKMPRNRPDASSVVPWVLGRTGTLGERAVPDPAESGGRRDRVPGYVPGRVRRGWPGQAAGIATCRTAQQPLMFG